MRARAVQLSKAVTVAHVVSSILLLKIDWLRQRFSGSISREK